MTFNIRTLFAPRTAPVVIHETAQSQEIGLYVVREGWRQGFIGRIVDVDYADEYAYKVAVRDERDEISVSWCAAWELAIAS